LRVGRTSIILIDGCHAVAISNGVTASDLIKRSSWSYKGNLNEEIWENLKGAINGQNKENNRNIGESQ
jgi:hypothetical protein